MKIEFGLLSILSVAFLLFFAFQGGQVELHSLDIGFSADSRGVTFTIDPAFVVWCPSASMREIRHIAGTFGNTILMDKHLRHSIYCKYILEHESNHVRQFYALGWFFFPAKYIVNIEPRSYAHINWSDPTEPDRTMWLPPEGWIDQWHFLSITVLHQEEYSAPSR